jgi:hypothetical protein
MFTMHVQELMILEGIPVYPPERRRLDLEALPAPPPKEPSEIEPPLREEEDP